MIFVCSRKRRHSLSRFIHLSRPRLPGRVLIDDDDDSYNGLELPPGWRYFMGARDSTVNLLNRAFEHHANEPWYAVVCDDMVYCTKDWDRILSQSCYDRYLAWGSDGRWNDTLCTSFFVGGDLVRAMGWLVHPSFGHLFADRLWWEIGSRAHIGRYHPEVHFEHRKQHDETFFERRIVGDRERFNEIMDTQINKLVERAKNAGELGRRNGESVADHTGGEKSEHSPHAQTRSRPTAQILSPSFGRDAGERA